MNFFNQMFGFQDPQQEALGGDIGMLDPRAAAWGQAFANMGAIATDRPTQSVGGAYMQAKQYNDRIRMNKAAMARQAEQDAMAREMFNLKKQQMTQPQGARFGQIGEGQYGWIDPAAQTVTPYGGGLESPAVDTEMIKLERDARKDYQKSFGAFQDQVLNNQKLETALRSGTGAGDYAAVISFVKSLDPTSVVREGEAAMASDVAGIYDRLQMFTEKLKEGERLSPKAKADYLNLSRQWLAKVAEAQQQRASDAQYRADRYNYDRRAVMGSPYDYAPVITPQLVDESFFADSVTPPPNPDDSDNPDNW